jgi:hypothetical protein
MRGVSVEYPSGVARCLLGELYSRGEAEFGVDVGEVGLHGAGRYEQPCGVSLLVSPPLSNRAMSSSAGTHQQLVSNYGLAIFVKRERCN